MYQELKNRHLSLQSKINEHGALGMLITSNTNILYLSGAIFNGCVFIPQEGSPYFLIRRPVGISGENVHYIRKAEDIESILPKEYFGGKILMETEITPFDEIQRYKKIFKTDDISGGSAVLREMRSIKSEYELSLLRKSAQAHMAAYRQIPLIYRDGMTDIELSIELEKVMRMEGSLGIFRIAGSSMEMYVGSLLAGDNADTPSPYDFAMGGQGLDVSLPVGANGTMIEGNMSVMVDFGGNFTGYMTDMTRTYSMGYIGERAHAAHQCSIAICRKIESIAKEGVAAADIYNIALSMAKEAGFEDSFMGHTQQAGFVGHGVGLEVNELPVLAPRSKDILKAGMVIALEPKFVIKGIGAVGIENTYIVHKDSLEKITKSDEQILPLTIFGCPAINPSQE